MIKNIQNSVHLLFTVFACCILISIAQNGYAQWSKQGKLKNNMTQNEVLEKWGEPVDKIEYETMRKQIWKYNTGEVTFIEGVVKDWQSFDENLKPIDKNEPKANIEDSKKSEKESDYAVEDILDELLRQTPSSKK